MSSHWGGGGGAKQAGSLVSSVKESDPIVGTPSSLPHLNLITSHRPHLLIPSHWGFEFQHMNLGETNIQSIAEVKRSSSVTENLNYLGSGKVQIYLHYPLMQVMQWHPTPVLLPGKSHGQRSLVGCGPWGR